VRDFVLWMANTFLGITPASLYAEGVFLAVGMGLSIAPMLLILLLFRQNLNQMNPLLFMLSLLGGIFIGLFVSLTPMVHNQRFTDCERQEVSYKGVYVTELWCADRATLDEPFGEYTFRRIVDAAR
jgi:hypothetical protein